MTRNRALALAFVLLTLAAAPAQASQAGWFAETAEAWRACGGGDCLNDRVPVYEGSQCDPVECTPEDDGIVAHGRMGVVDEAFDDESDHCTGSCMLPEGHGEVTVLRKGDPCPEGLACMTVGIK